MSGPRNFSTRTLDSELLIHRERGQSPNSHGFRESPISD